MRFLFQRLPWVGRSQAVVDEFLAFLSNLVSAQTVYLCACLKMVVSHFTPSKPLTTGPPVRQMLRLPAEDKLVSLFFRAGDHL